VHFSTFSRLSFQLLNGRRKDFSQEGEIKDFFQVAAKSFIPGVPTVVKFHFSNSKLTEKHFSAQN